MNMSRNIGNLLLTRPVTTCEARFTEPRLWFQDSEKPPNEGNGDEKVKGRDRDEGEKDKEKK